MVRRMVLFSPMYALLPDKSECTYNILLRKQKAAINSFEENFLTRMLFSPFPNVIRKIQSEGLTAQYQEEIQFLLKVKMLPSLSFVPEQDVDCFNIIMTDFPESALNVARYFEETYIGKRRSTIHYYDLENVRNGTSATSADK